MTPHRGSDRRPEAGGMPLSAVVYSACLVLAAGWYALVALHVTVASPPPLPTDRTARFTTFLLYFRSTVPQQCILLVIASTGFAALYVFTGRMTSMTDQGWPARLCRLGATLFITAQLVQFGGYRRVYDTSLTTGRDLTADVVTLQLVDAIDDALELGAFTLLGAGMLGLGIASRNDPAARAWSPWSTLAGVLHLAVAGAMAVAAWTIADVLLVAGGLIAAPVWALRLGRAMADAARAGGETTGAPAPSAGRAGTAR